MKYKRVFVEKHPEFQVKAKSLLAELNENLQLDIKWLRLLNVYDLSGFSEELCERCRYTVFGEIVTDNVTFDCELSDVKQIAVEYLPGQFDQRASSAEDCVRLIDPGAEIAIRSSELLLFPFETEDAVLQKIKHYYINAVEAREKDLSKTWWEESTDVAPTFVLKGFCEISENEAEKYCSEHSLAMNADDLIEVINYFRQEGRDPSDTELKIIDTYWSDHCRHTTFTTELTDIKIEDSFIKDDMDESMSLYLKMRKELGSKKDICLMDMATIGAKYLRSKGLLDDMEVSEENNACSIYVDVDNDGKQEKWLLMFKNETHNHPTEIEPFGGAATCLGGAIRDPLSGRSYVYQAMRVTGAGDIHKPVSETIPGKLPQKVISRKADHGYSRYGKQIGLATSYVKEIFHPGYTAKRMEIGAVVGAVKAEYVRRETPAPGDIVMMIGGRTGRDGIGGATGSSKGHTGTSLATCGSEVQKGNPPEERKLQRLFRRPEVTLLIKKSNDFGAGGVSVAIGELAEGLDIYLDRIPVKYRGLNATELAISESQERMAVVISASDKEKFLSFCSEENIEATYVADVTGLGRMRMFFGGETIVDLSRAFIDSTGAKHYSKAVVSRVEERNPFSLSDNGRSVKDRFFDLMSRPDVCSQKGLAEMFDSTIGRSTVLLPFGGMLQSTETQVSVQKLPTDGYTDTASVMAYGYNPVLSSWSPYHGAAYAVVEACAKIVACGASYERIRFSFQEYFRRMTSDPHTWGEPVSALLGALRMQVELGLPSIGGKDSMSGSFEGISVPPTLVAFGITTVSASVVISPELKWGGNRLYVVKHTPLPNYMPNVGQLKDNWSYVSSQIASGNIVSAFAVGGGQSGVAEALCKMAFGNAFGVRAKASSELLFAVAPGSIVVEVEHALDHPNAIYLGDVLSGGDDNIIINGTSIDLYELMKANQNAISDVYPVTSRPDMRRVIPKQMEGIKPYKAKKADLKYKGEKVEHPIAYLPVFPGTNCDYDTAKAFRKAGAQIKTTVFRNLSEADIFASIEDMRKNISECHILALCGGFSAGDEPDGSGKFIANVLNNKIIASAIEDLIARGGLILGICNGFQALVKSGLLPYGKLGKITKDSPTLFRNDINRHVSQMVTTKVSSVNSPWLAGMNIGDEHTIAVSHGEGKFVVNEELAKELFENGQVAFQYKSPISDQVTMEFPYNPNGSYYAMEGIISKNGQILGKMGHSERYEKNLFKNIQGDMEQPIFENAVKYFKGA